MMEGVTTAILAFLLLCVVFPSLVKNKPQYYGALAAVLLIILMQSIAAISGNPRFAGVAGGVCGLLQVGAILLLILCAGGLSVRDLAGDIGKTIEVVRRGDSTKTVIIPLGGDQPKPRRERTEAARVDLDREAEDLGDLPPGGYPRRPPEAKPDAPSSIPLE